MIVTPNGVMLTRAEFEKLPDYSCSLPTGTTIGKQWKRRVPYMIQTNPPNEWYLGEYVESLKAGEIGIEWTLILMPPESVPTGNRTAPASTTESTNQQEKEH